jgi:hypothetical protein
MHGAQPPSAIADELDAAVAGFNLSAIGGPVHGELVKLQSVQASVSSMAAPATSLAEDAQDVHDQLKGQKGRCTIFLGKARLGHRRGAQMPLLTADADSFVMLHLCRHLWRLEPACNADG